uniref:FERM domain-containing protein n=2 Tax=Caenorhabditis japonica TaxID=281687 RepID=A0A8R1DU63_CAEJA
MSWFFQSKIAKSHFYVWYLGSKEADGVRGSAVVLPVMRQLLKESFKKTPSKATVQISSKGLKLIQSVPAMSRSGKVKMQLVKFQIAANCITYSVTGKAPFDDVVGVVMLVLNPEMQSPMHVHCYRCDSAETAQIMLANLQLLLSRPDVQRSINDLEHRLFLSGLLVPRRNDDNNNNSNELRPQRSCSQSRSHSRSTTGYDERISPLGREQRSRETTIDKNTPPIRPQTSTISRRVVDEIKNRIIGESRLMNLGRSRESSLTRYESEKRASLSELPIETDSTRYRMFGDTMIRDTKNKSRKQKGKDREPDDQQHHPPPATSPAPSQHPRNPKMQAARVRLPVGVYKEFEVNRGSEGEALFRQVTSDLSIEERDYFSLCFYDKEEGIRHWLYNDKKILKQLKNLP